MPRRKQNPPKGIDIDLTNDSDTESENKYNSVLAKPRKGSSIVKKQKNIIMKYNQFKKNTNKGIKIYEKKGVGKSSKKGVGKLSNKGVGTRLKKGVGTTLKKGVAKSSKKDVGTRLNKGVGKLSNKGVGIRSNTKRVKRQISEKSNAYRIFNVLKKI